RHAVPVASIGALRALDHEMLHRLRRGTGLWKPRVSITNSEPPRGAEAPLLHRISSGARPCHAKYRTAAVVAVGLGMPTPTKARKVPRYSEARAKTRFSARAMRIDADTVNTTAATVMLRLRSDFNATNVGVGRLTSKPNVVAAVSRWTPAHNTVSWMNRRKM